MAPLTASNTSTVTSATVCMEQKQQIINGNNKTKCLENNNKPAYYSDGSIAAVTQKGDTNQNTMQHYCSSFTVG